MEALDLHPHPEVLRVPLESFCLKARIMSPANSKLMDVVAAAPTAPETGAVDRAVAALENLGAITPGGEFCTPLGARIALLPVEPRIGLSLFTAAALGCLTPTAFVAACASAPRLPFKQQGGNSGSGGGGAVGGAAREFSAACLDKTSCFLACLRAAGQRAELGPSIDSVVMKAVIEQQKQLIREMKGHFTEAQAVDDRSQDMSLVRACISVASFLMRISSSKRGLALHWLRPQSKKGAALELKPHQATVLATPEAARIVAKNSDFLSLCCVQSVFSSSRRGPVATDTTR